MWKRFILWLTSRHIFDRHDTLARFTILRHSRVWSVAEEAVAKVAAQEHIQKAALVEDMVAFCPRCGQIPDGDRRMEEAREISVEKLKYHGVKHVRRSDLDFAIAYHYWSMKENK